MLYGASSTPPSASLSEDVLTVTFNGLSKNYRSPVATAPAGWWCRRQRPAADYIEGLNMLASMRLCANVPSQYGIQTALGGYQSIDDLVAPGGRMRRQRDLATDDHRHPRRHLRRSRRPRCTCSRASTRRCIPSRTTSSSSPNCSRPKRVLLVQGTGFNWPSPRPLPAGLPAPRGRPA